MAKILHPNNSSIHSHPRWADFLSRLGIFPAIFIFFCFACGGDDLGAGDFSITQQIAVRYLGVLRVDCGSLRIQEYFLYDIFLELYCGFGAGIVLDFFGYIIQPFGVKDIKSMLQNSPKLRILIFMKRCFKPIVFI